MAIGKLGVETEEPDRIWWDEIDEDWRTDFPPPSGFDGEVVLFVSR